MLQGLGSTSVQWGAWGGSGMAAQDRSTALRVERMGMELIRPGEGLAALVGLLGTVGGPAVHTAVPFNWPRFIKAQRGPVPALFEEFESAAEPAARAAARPTAGGRLLRAAPQARPAAPSADRVEAIVRGVVASILGAEVASDLPLMASGLDSLSSVEFKNSLESELGLELPSTLIFDYPTTNAIVQHVLTLGGGAAERQ